MSNVSTYDRNPSAVITAARKWLGENSIAYIFYPSQIRETLQRPSVNAVARIVRTDNTENGPVLGAEGTATMHKFTLRVYTAPDVSTDRKVDIREILSDNEAKWPTPEWIPEDPTPQQLEKLGDAAADAFSFPTFGTEKVAA